MIIFPVVYLVDKAMIGTHPQRGVQSAFAARHTDYLLDALESVGERLIVLPTPPARPTMGRKRLSDAIIQSYIHSTKSGETMDAKEQARQQIEQLVASFKADKKRKVHVEQEMRLYYILPLFRALGWVIENPSEVTAEEQISRGYVDFGFYLNGVPRFYLETKRVSDKLDDIENMRQSINYSYLKGVTWAVLTDFEKLIIFNAEWAERNPRDTIFMDFAHDEFVTRFDDLWLLSKASLELREIDHLAEKFHKKAKKEPVTVSLFNSLTDWRKRLFDEIRFQGLTSWAQDNRQVDNAVQKFFDRLIFLRTVEDRGIEEPHLKTIQRQYKPELVFDQLLKKFRELDSVYNSNLFAHHALDTMKVYDPGLITEIIEGLYKPKSSLIQYDFNAITADVLGAVYEQYLGFKATDPSASVDTKSLKRKSQGIYYTPQYIVRYIVQQTLGKLLASGVDPHTITVVDPACGSGSFLIEAFDVLDRFLATQEKDVPAHERRERILKENLYGVDLDEQAVEVTRLNLMLRASFQRTKLPLLTHIVHGNSLIHTDEVAGAGLGFAWQERFSQVFERGGFDVVVGNPPYVRQETLGSAFKAYAKQPYQQTFAGTNDLYVYFMERGYSLLRAGGKMGYIVPNKWMRANYGKGLRTYLQDKIETLIDFGDLPVFPTAITYPLIVTLAKVPTLNPSPILGEGLEDSLSPQISAPASHSLFPRSGERAGDRGAFDRQQQAPAANDEDSGITPHPQPPAPLRGEGAKDVDDLDATAASNSLSPRSGERAGDRGAFDGDKVRVWRSHDLWEALKPLARQMRHEPTRAENELWQRLRGNKIANAKFRRQHPIDRFIADFYCSSARLVVEVDGEIHQYTQEEDAIRQQFIESLDIRVLRFTNEEVLTRIEDVIAQIEVALRTVPTLNPSPILGEGLEDSLSPQISAPASHSLSPQISAPASHSLSPQISASASHSLSPRSGERAGDRGASDVDRDAFVQVATVKDLPTTSNDTLEPHLNPFYSVQRAHLDPKGWTLAAETGQALLDKLKARGVPLGEYVEGKIYYGIKTGYNEAFVIDGVTRAKLIRQDPKSAEIIKPFLAGRDVKRYEQPSSNNYLISIPNGWTRPQIGDVDAWGWLQSHYPSIAHHLAPFAEKAAIRSDQGEYWWELRPCAYYAEFEKPKIVYPNILKQPEFAFDSEGWYTNQKCFIIPIPDKYLLAILNSKVNFFLFRKILPGLQGGFFEPSYVFFKEFPIPRLDLTNAAQKAQHDAMVALVERMMRLKSELQALENTLSDKRHEIREELERTDQKIDRLVYDLYGLTEAEIALVEGK